MTESWYTEPFFVSQRASFDRAASDGPVQPPASIIESVQGCTAVEGDLSTTAGSDEPTPIGLITRTMSTIVPITTTAPDGILTTSSPSTYITTMASVPSQSGLTPSSMSYNPASTGLSQAPTDPSAISSCAGDWDWQAWGAIASLGFGLIVGGILWLLWLVLKRTLPALYSPRQWFVEER